MKKRKAKCETTWIAAFIICSAERIVWVQYCKYKPKLSRQTNVDESLCSACSLTEDIMTENSRLPSLLLWIKSMTWIFTGIFCEMNPGASVGFHPQSLISNYQINNISWSKSAYLPKALISSLILNGIVRLVLLLEVPAKCLFLMSWTTTISMETWETERVYLIMYKWYLIFL